MLEQSRPTRGAWIETFHALAITVVSVVAPHAGRVD